MINTNIWAVISDAVFIADFFDFSFDHNIEFGHAFINIMKQKRPAELNIETLIARTAHGRY